MFFELIKAIICVICCGFKIFEFIYVVIDKRPPRGNLCAITDFVFGNRHRRDNNPSRKLEDAVNWKANAVKLLCARSHSNASKLDAVLVKQCFTLCSVATRDVLSSSIQGVPHVRKLLCECLDMCSTDNRP